MYGTWRLSIKGCLEQLHTVRYEMLNTEFKFALVQGLMAMGQSDEAMTLIDETIRLIRDRTATKNRVALIKHDAAAGNRK